MLIKPIIITDEINKRVTVKYFMNFSDNQNIKKKIEYSNEYYQFTISNQTE